jgi:hypothetical protein
MRESEAMGDLETLAQQGSADDFLAAVRTRLNARSLVEDADVPLPAIAVQRLLQIAADAQPRPQIGVKGYLRAAGIDDASGEYFATVTFDDQETARRVGDLIFADVSLEPFLETPAAANEERSHAAE